MAVIYQPNTFYMSPQSESVTIDSAAKFSLKFSGVCCNAYSVNILDYSNSVIFKQPLQILESPIYNEETIECEIILDAELFNSGQYYWYIELYSLITEIATIDVINSNLIISDNPFVNGDCVKIWGDIPSNLDNSTFYYIRTHGSKIYLYPSYEGAKSDTDTNDQIKFDQNFVKMESSYIAASINSMMVPFNICPDVMLTLDSGTIQTQKYTFKPDYSHASQYRIVSFVASLYDSQRNLIEESKTIYSSNCRYSFSGLIGGNKYYVNFDAVNIAGKKLSTGLTLYNVVYTPFSYLNKLNVKKIDEQAGIKISWNKPSVNIPNVTGDYEYCEVCESGNRAVKVKSPKISYMGLNNELQDLYMGFRWKPSKETFDGKILKHYKGNNGITILYDRTNKSFYRKLDYENDSILLTATNKYQLWHDAVFDIETNNYNITVNGYIDPLVRLIMQDINTLHYFEIYLSDGILKTREINNSFRNDKLIISSGAEQYQIYIESGIVKIKKTLESACGTPYLRDEITRKENKLMIGNNQITCTCIENDADEDNLNNSVLKLINDMNKRYVIGFKKVVDNVMGLTIREKYVFKEKQNFLDTINLKNNYSSTQQQVFLECTSLINTYESSEIEVV